MDDAEYQRFVERVTSRCEECGDCLLWQGAMTNKSVPVLSVGGNARPIRRILWAGMGKVLIRGRSIVSGCGHDACVEPSHLEQVKRGRRKGYKMRPDQRANIATARRALSKLTMDDVRKIRAFDESKEAIAYAAEKGVGFSMVGKIRRNRHWREVLHTPFAGLMP